MITEMKKITILVSKAQQAQALIELKELGVLHVEHCTPPAAPVLETISGMVSLYEKALTLLAPYQVTQLGQVTGKDCTGIAKKIIELSERRRELEVVLNDIDDAIAEQMLWGDFSRDDVVAMAAEGVYIKFFTAQKKDIEAGSSLQVPFRIIGRTSSKLYGVCVARYPDAPVPGIEVPLPSKTLRMLREQKEETKQELTLLERDIQELAKLRHCLKEKADASREALEFEQVRFGMGSEEAFLYLRGYCPAPQLNVVADAARHYRWGIISEPIGDEEDAPVLLDPSAAARPIIPVFDFMSTVPGYHEYDISFIFLAFFSLFFAM